MTFVVANRVRESSSTLGAGTITLTGNLSNYQTFASAVGSGNTCRYCIVNTGSTNEWEIGTGTVTESGGTTYLSRDQIESSSNLDAVVTLTTGTKLVTLVYSAEQLKSTIVLADISGTGLLVKNAVSTAVVRTLSVSPALSITNPSGVSGDPQLGVNAELSAEAFLGTTGFVVRPASGQRVTRAITVSAGLSVTNGDGVNSSPHIYIVSSEIGPIIGLGTAAYQNVGSSVTNVPDVSIANTLYYTIASGQAVASVATVNTAAITSINAVTTSINQTVSVNGAAITSVDSRITSVNAAQTAALASVESVLSGRVTSVNNNVLHDPSANGFVVRTASTSTTARTITGGTYITISNGDGVAGNPSVSLDTSATNLLYARLSANQTLTGSNTFTSAVAFQVTIQTSGLDARGPAFATPVSLTDATSIAVNMSRGINFVVQLGGNRTLEAPTNCQPGQTGVIYFIQDGTGSRTLAYNSVWKFPAGSTPTLTTTSAARDMLSYFVYSSSQIDAAINKDFR